MEDLISHAGSPSDDSKNLFTARMLLMLERRTMCLNYEERRHDANRPFRKKNVNLKFSRMLTVFATVLPLIAQLADSVPKLAGLCTKTPLDVEDFLTEQKTTVNERAKDLSTFLYDALTHSNVRSEFRRYLIL